MTTGRDVLARFDSFREYIAELNGRSCAACEGWVSGQVERVTGWKNLVRAQRKALFDWQAFEHKRTCPEVECNSACRDNVRLNVESRIAQAFREIEEAPREELLEYRKPE